MDTYTTRVLTMNELPLLPDYPLLQLIHHPLAPLDLERSALRMHLVGRRLPLRVIVPLKRVPGSSYCGPADLRLLSSLCSAKYVGNPQCNE